MSKISRTSRHCATLALALVALSAANPAQARWHHRHLAYDQGHGNCLRFNKDTGTVAGAAAGGLLGNAVGGTGGLVVGAVGGGLAGHHFAHNRRKRC